MAATARLIVMVEQDEKASLEAQAQDARVSTAELVRRRLFGRGDRAEDGLLEILAELKPLVQRAARTIDANLAEIRAFREQSDARDERVAAGARRELTRHELAAFAERLQPAPRARAAGRPRGGRA